MKKAFITVIGLLIFLSTRAQIPSSADTLTDSIRQKIQYCPQYEGIRDTSLVEKTDQVRAWQYIDWLVTANLRLKKNTVGTFFLSRVIPNLIITNQQIIRITAYGEDAWLIFYEGNESYLKKELMQVIIP